MSLYQIKRCLEKQLAIAFSEDPSIIVTEFELCQGVVRADFAVVNGHLHGYEIKSNEDTLDRLKLQIEFYSKVFDFVTIVIGERHLKKARSMVPPWWGIWVAANKKKKIGIRQLRKPKQNQAIDRYSLAQLLWRDEALEILGQLGKEKGLKSKPRKILWEVVSKELDTESLGEQVRATIKLRRDWRADAIRTQYDEKHLLLSK